MSATLMGAVMNCGPVKGSMRYVLLAIADNADDYGFSCPSIETIAAKACCDERTAMRLVQQLEREGWIAVRRRVLGGKGSVYFMDVTKVGAVVGAKSRKSPLHVEIAKMLDVKKVAAKPAPPAPADADAAPASAVESSGDNLSPELQASAVEDFVAPEKSGDNPQGVQVTKTAESGDKRPVAILKNRCEPLLNPNTTTPLPPDGGSCDLLSVEDAVARVESECNLCDPRLTPKIARAMTAFMRKTGKSADAVAELMIANQREYVRLGEYLRVTVGWPKFFSQGYWIDHAGWPLDQAAMNARRNASIGTRW